MPPPLMQRQRWRLTLLALLGASTVQIIALLPMALGVALVAGMYPHPLFVWGGGLVLVGTWWLMQGGDEPEGLEVTRDQAPGLWAMLDELAQAMQVKVPKRVVLVTDATAAAVDHQDRWWPWVYRQTLVLGVPLLQGLSATEMKAVLAHELAHFSRHFGWGGHWLYRARAGWTALLSADHADESVWYRAAGAYARWFAPMFQRLTVAESVANEYEADALAARVCAPQALASALLRLSASQLPERRLRFGDGPCPPQALRDQGLRMAVPLAADGVAQALDLDAAAHSAADPLSHTHPPTRARIQAVLGAWPQSMSLAEVAPDQAAGPTWWGGAWPDVLAQAEQAWRRVWLRAWSAQAAWHAVCEARLSALSLANAPTPDSPGFAERLECLLALDQPGFDEAQPTLPGQDAIEPLAVFWWAAALIQAQHPQALAWAETAVQRAPALAAPMRRHLAFETPVGLSAGERQRQTTLWERALARRDAARAMALQAGPRGVQVCALAPWRTEALRQALASDTAVQRASVLSYDLTLSDGRRFEVAMLCVQIDAANGVQETEIQDVYAKLLARVATPLRVAVIQSWWSTETWPQWVVDHEGQHPMAVLKLPSS
ncbi:MAG: hypothetical protein C4K60_13615 [Ideonella sp. MAG2]|nr:MAG: hypothetical protein C4K60_13615 [Ideonella sp. MAG2]